MKKPFTMFGKTKNITVRTFTNQKEDIPACKIWDKELWVEREEDWYALSALRKYTTRVVTREEWIKCDEVFNDILGIK